MSCSFSTEQCSRKIHWITWTLFFAWINEWNARLYWALRAIKQGFAISYLAQQRSVASYDYNVNRWGQSERYIVLKIRQQIVAVPASQAASYAVHHLFSVTSSSYCISNSTTPRHMWPATTRSQNQILHSWSALKLEEASVKTLFSENGDTLMAPDQSTKNWLTRNHVLSSAT